MASLDRLAALAGTWLATYQLRGDPSFESDSPSTASVTPVLGGRFVRIDYTWDENDVLQENGPQEGSLLVGHDPSTDPPETTVVWVDSWHNKDRMLISEGSLLENGGVDVRGSTPGYEGGPDWGWRTRLEPEPDGWTVTMWVITPEGEEGLAVQAEYRRRP
jgi:hypothetical protein